MNLLTFRNTFYLYIKLLLIFIINSKSSNLSQFQSNRLYLVDQTKIKNNHDKILSVQRENSTNSYDEYDLNLILNYEGGPIESEWQWVKNISIVYTWVDGSDVNFQDLKSKYNGGIRKVNSRDRSADELRYSIRSLEKYMPWHEGPIFIVTCQQIPKWLDVHHPRVKIIDHKTIFPRKVFPTFDSGTIELFLDKIPGISERFIYFNDDFFINRHLHPSFFFTLNGFPKHYRNSNLLRVSRNGHRRNISKGKNLFNSMCYNTRQLIRTYLDRDYQYYFLHHSPYVFYRDLMEPFRQFFKDDLKVLCIDKFRNWEKSHGLYLYLTFMEYASRNKELNLFDESELPKDRTITDYSCQVMPASLTSHLIKFGMVTNDSEKNEELFRSIHRHPNLLIFSFNDVYSKHQAFLEFTEFLMRRYPEASSFEKEEYKGLEERAYSRLLNYPTIKNSDSNQVTNSVEDEDLKLYKTVRQHNLNVTENYLNEKEKLSGPKTTMSDREKEEIDFLLRYNGENCDPAWEWAKKMSIVYSVVESKHDSIRTEIDKLKYSIRSIEKYMPWFDGTIFIIVREEHKRKFDWISSSNKRIQLIDPHLLLPTTDGNVNINRYAIEMFLDKIPGLSERFIYLYPHHFFIHYVHPRFFFSKEFYPKYNFEDMISGDEADELKETDKSFFHTSQVILNYFGKNYVNGYRYLKNAPYPLYRDLFDPVRQLYTKYVKKLVEGPEDRTILPLYLITTYNIYGTHHPYYPEVIGGYGKVRKFQSSASLNPSRTIDFYGFDITSPAISNATMSLDIPFARKASMVDRFLRKTTCESKETLDQILSEGKLFFSLKEINDREGHSIFDWDCFLKIMTSLYEEKSSFEL